MNAEQTTTLETDPRFPSGPWTGFFLQKEIPGKHTMELRLTFRAGSMTGEGRDWVGPFLVTADEIGNRPMRVTTRVNGELRQDDTTDRLTWGFAWLINYISTFATLRPGDLIWTGTPTGAGGHHTPPKWLKPGDVVEVEVPEIGVLRNTVVDEA